MAGILYLFLPTHLNAQITVGSLPDQQLRLNALLSDSVRVPLIDRPVSYRNYSNALNQKFHTPTGWWTRDLSPTYIYNKNDIKIGLLPFEIQQTFNSRIPYGENNGAAWYGRGSNVEYRGGFYGESKHVSVQISPHIIYQENLDFRIPRFIPRDSNGNIRYVAEGIGPALGVAETLDAPFRFGPDPFTTFDPGNSSIRVYYKNLETGLSTEPLWWGPAVRYSLLFSNNAAGIPHFLFGSKQPYQIPYFGDLQFKWIFGYPEDSRYYDGPGQNQTRFTTAIHMAYNPLFYKNITLGVTRAIHIYEVAGFSLGNALLPINPSTNSAQFNKESQESLSQNRNQAVSIYAHIQLPGANAEIYGEFYREDHSHDVRDFINQPHHNSGYAFGFQKISYLPWIDFLKTNVEITNLTTTQLKQVRPQAYYYTHSSIWQGHTNRGQILGAAIGPGSNSQYFSLDAYRDDYKVGLFAQRWVDNNNFHFMLGSADLAPSNEFGDYFRHRVNLNFGLNFLYGPGPFYLNGKFMWTKAYNYGRFNYGEFEGVNIRNYEHDDLINIQFQLGISYIF